jgi:hypothetical protein
MKTFFSMKCIVSLTLILLTIKICGAQTSIHKKKSFPSLLVVFTPTTYEKIMNMHKEYTSRPHPLPADDRLVKNSGMIRSITTDTVIAVIGWTGRKLSVDIYPNTPSTRNAIKINGRQGALERKIQSNRRAPSDLDAFPIEIKMDKAAFDTIWKYTECQSFLFFPCIEKGWNGSTHPHDDHFTLAILGSEKRSNDISHLHTAHMIDKKQFRKAQLLNDALAGAETWPYESFSWVELNAMKN